MKLGLRENLGSTIFDLILPILKGPSFPNKILSGLKDGRHAAIRYMQHSVTTYIRNMAAACGGSTVASTRNWLTNRSTDVIKPLPGLLASGERQFGGNCAHAASQESDRQTKFDIERRVQIPHCRQGKQQHCNVRDDVRKRGPSVNGVEIQAATSWKTSIPIAMKRNTQQERRQGKSQPIRKHDCGDYPTGHTIHPVNKYPSIKC